MQQLKRKEGQGFTYIGNSFGGRLYSTWKPHRNLPSIFAVLSQMWFSVSVAVATSILLYCLLRVLNLNLVIIPGLLVLVLGLAYHFNGSFQRMALRRQSRLIGLIPLVPMLAMIWTDIRPPIYLFINLPFILFEFFRETCSKRHQKKLLEALPLCDNPSPIQLFPVQVSIHRNGILLGEDLDWIGLVDGFLHFQGSATEFNLIREDMELKIAHRIDWRFLVWSVTTSTYPLRFTLEWSDKFSKQSAKFEIVAENERIEQLSEQLVHVLKSWESEPPPRDQLPAYPPNYADPSLIVQTNSIVRVSFRFGRTAAFIAALAYVASIYLPYNLNAQTIFATAFLLFGSVAAISFYINTASSKRLKNLPADALEGRYPS